MGGGDTIEEGFGFGEGAGEAVEDVAAVDAGVLFEDAFEAFTQDLAGIGFVGVSAAEVVDLFL
jgi:hypothetical protein